MKVARPTLRRTFLMTIVCVAIAVATDTAFAGGTRNFTVNTTSDSVVLGACDNRTAGCSLRGALAASNPAGDAIIRFNIAPSDAGCSSGVCTITITSALPALISPNVSIIGPGADRLRVQPSPTLIATLFVVNNNGGPVSISGMTIRGGRMNNATAAGIDKSGGGLLHLTDIALLNNASSGQGPGGIRVAAGAVAITHSTLAGNQTSVGSGGAVLAVLDSQLSIRQSTLANNSAGSVGGAISAAGTLFVSHSTIAFNESTHGPGGVSRPTTFSGSAVFMSTIIARNRAGSTFDDVRGFLESFGHNLVGVADSNSGFNTPTDIKGTAASPLDPLFETNIRNNGGVTPTLALRADSPAIDKGTNASIGEPVITDQRRGFFQRVRDNPRIPNATSGNGVDIGAFERQSFLPFDFDADMKADIGIYRPSDGTWWINPSSTGNTFVAGFGSSTDKMVPSDFTGDGKTDIAVWQPSSGTWYVLRSEDSSFFAFPFGTDGDIPVSADFDNDGRTDPGVFRPSNAVWFIQRSAGGTTIEQFGSTGDVPVVSDYDGDGRADIAIYRPSNGQWWLNRSVAGVLTVTFGTSTDKPTPGDFTGDGKTDVAIFRPSTGQWFVLRSENFSFFGFPFGTFGDLPAAGDYDGDGKVDAVVFRPSNATWFIQRSAGGTTITQFGANGDRPVANAFVP